MGAKAEGKIIVTQFNAIEEKTHNPFQTERTHRTGIHGVQLDIKLLGSFQVYRNGELIKAKEWKTNKEKSLLKILLTRPGNTFLQEQLTTLLWENLTPRAALKNLWVCINHLRHILEPSLDKPANSRFILSYSNGYQFTPENICTIDTNSFLDLVKQGDSQLNQKDYESAIKSYKAAEVLYRGDFLDEDLYEDWSIEVRYHLKARYLDLLNNLGDLYQQAGQNGEALKCSQKFLLKEACRESVWRKVMLCYWRNGERDQALLAYKHCAEILKKEFAVEPMTETIELRNNIARGM